MTKIEKKKILSRPYVVLTIIMVIAFIIDNFTGRFLTNNGGAVLPRDFGHITGIFFSSLLHSNFSHISSNLIPFLFFGLLLSKTMNDSTFYFMWVFISIFSGTFVWLFGSTSFHLGASGVIFGMWSLIITLACKRRTFNDILVGTCVLIAYGSTFIFGLFPREGISFSGHLWGLVGGIVFAHFFIKEDKK